MTVNITQNVTPRHRRATKVPSWHRSPKFKFQYGNSNSATLTLVLGIIIVIAVASLSFFYLRQVLNTASQGNEIQALEERLVDLKERQKELELEGAELRSIQTIEDNVPHLNLVETKKVTYLIDPNHRTTALAE